MRTRMRNAFNIKTSETSVTVMLDTTVIATFLTESHFSLTINHEAIESLRSNNMRSIAYKKISEAFETCIHYTSGSHDYMSIHAIDSVMKALGLSMEDLSSIEQIHREDILKSINAMDYTYTNIWFSSRMSLNSQLGSFFQNNSDNENDLLVALLMSDNINTANNLIQSPTFFPLVKIHDKIVNEVNYLEHIQKSMQFDMNCEDDYSCFENTFESLNDVTKYYDKILK